MRWQFSICLWGEGNTTQTTNQWYLKLVIPQAQCLQVSLLPSQLLEWEWVWQLADWTRCSVEISMFKVVQ